MKNLIRILLIPTILVFFVYSCKKKTPEPIAAISCGQEFDEECLSRKWIITTPPNAQVSVLNDYENRNCLLLTNPHDSDVLNPQSIRMESMIQNIEKDAAYQVVCDVKIKGYPDAVTNGVSFAFFVFNQEKWFGHKYYSSAPKQWHETDWQTMKMNFIGTSTKTLNFELYSMYDSLWISNLRIEKL